MSKYIQMKGHGTLETVDECESMSEQMLERMNERKHGLQTLLEQYEMSDIEALVRYIYASYINGQKKQAAEILSELHEELSYDTGRPSGLIVDTWKDQMFELEILGKINDHPSILGVINADLIQ